MTEGVKDSVEAALELNERELYSHIAHESAEDIIRIISSIDAERARLHGEVIYYKDDWDELIRERLAKGKRHTAFDFYNPALFNTWEEKVNTAKKVKKLEKAAYATVGGAFVVTLLASVVTREPYVLIGAAILPLLILIRDTSKDKLDLLYYQLTQLFIDELRAIVTKHSLPPERYKFKLFSGGYMGVATRKLGTGVFATVETEKHMGKD